MIHKERSGEIIYAIMFLAAPIVFFEPSPKVVQGGIYNGFYILHNVKCAPTGAIEGIVK
jgi:hypothetical protein